MSIDSFSRLLGDDIWLYEQEDPACIAELEASHSRFLNALWLPLPLSQLSQEQICIINRFRERTLEADPQFAHAALSRQAMRKVIERLAPRRLIEYGCGKFPLSDRERDESYVGIDIDAEARLFCETNGLRVIEDPDQLDLPPDGLTLIVSLYAMHFLLREEDLAFLCKGADRTVVLVICILVREPAHFLGLITTLSVTYPNVSIVKTPLLAKSEVFLVMTPRGLSSLNEEVVDQLRSALT